MKSSVKQKQYERFLLEKFLEKAPFQAKILEEREAPDFIVRFDGRSIGVEITNLFISRDENRNLLQEQESISTKIVTRSQQIYQELGAPPVHVGVCFYPNRDLRKLNRVHTAKELASFVKGLNLAEGKRVVLRPHDFLGFLPGEISFVNVLGVPSFAMARWYVGRAGWVAHLTIENLQERIDEKEKQILKYLNTVKENWLVIVSDSKNPSGLFEVPSNFDPRGVSSPFSRTFFYGHPRGPVISLGP